MSNQDLNQVPMELAGIPCGDTSCCVHCLLPISLFLAQPHDPIVGHSAAALPASGTSVASILSARPTSLDLVPALTFPEHAPSLLVYFVLYFCI